MALGASASMSASDADAHRIAATAIAAQTASGYPCNPSWLRNLPGPFGNTRTIRTTLAGHPLLTVHASCAKAQGWWFISADLRLRGTTNRYRSGPLAYGQSPIAIL